jgi:predicted nucleic acid-binding protein
MIALDTSTLVAFLRGEDGLDIAPVATALETGELCLPPAVITEAMTHEPDRKALTALFARMIVLPVTDGFWVRAGHLRGALVAKGRKARLGDALIAQSCIDAGAALITRDRDFRHFAEFGLTLAVEV